MPQFLIERQIPGAGKLSSAELKAISQKSCGVLRDMNAAGKDVQWVHSYVTGDKIFCVYNAPNAKAVKEHADEGRIPRQQHYAGGADDQPDNRRDRLSARGRSVPLTRR